MMFLASGLSLTPTLMMIPSSNSAMLWMITTH
jgi:hypothetical protein